MLSNKLEQAKRDAKRRLIKITLVSGAILAIGILSLFSLSQGQDKNQDTEDAMRSVGGSVEPETINAASLTDSETTQPAPNQVIADGVEREAFKRALNKFEQNVETRIVTAEFKEWNAQVQNKITVLKDDAVAAFSEGEYNHANTLIEKADSLAEQELSARDMAFQHALSQAIDAKLADHYDEALLHVTEALRLQRNSPDALTLLRDIEKLPELLDLIKQAQIAQTENNPQDELEALIGAFDLDPTRISLRERADTIARHMKEQAFASHIVNGINDVDDRDLKSATANLVAVASLYPDSPEVALLRSRVSDLGKVLETEHWLREAEAAGAADNWKRAVAFFDNALTIQPDNQKTVDGHALALRISGSQDSLSKFLSAPHRLSASNVTTLAKTAVTEAKLYKALSPSLRSMIQELEEQVVLYSTKVSIRVISDGLTEVAVRGVGRIGTTLEKVLNLTPGNYSFEGKREGYRAVLVNVKILPGVGDVEVKVVCDEPI